jgi:competence protein ComEC
MKILFILYSSIIAISIALIFGLENLPTMNGKLEVSVLDVGQGDAIFIRTPVNQKIIIDAGPASNVLLPLAQELNFFDRKIDLVVITHPDADHIAGFKEILRRYEIGKILLTGVQHDTAYYRDILQQIDSQKIPLIFASPDADFDFGNGVMLDVVWPYKLFIGHKPSDANALSVTTRLSFGDTAIMLTGDLDQESEEILLKTPQNLQAEILKLGHHGSDTSSSEEFLAAVSSQIAVVSAGKDNSFGHPKPAVLERVKDQKVFETAKSGSLKFLSNGSFWRLGFGD